MQEWHFANWAESSKAGVSPVTNLSSGSSMTGVSPVKDMNSRDGCSTAPALRNDASCLQPDAPALQNGVPDLQNDLLIARRKLPHWRLAGSVYFVTFTTIEREALKQRSSLSTPEDYPVFSPAERDIVLSACRHWHEKRAFFHGIVVMPDHVHLLVQPYAGEELSKLLHSIKSFSAHAINRHRGARGIVWLAESMDRIVRDEAEFVQKLNYLARNPVRGGLSERAEEYDWLFIGGEWTKGSAATGR